MANKIILPLMLLLVVAFGVVSFVAFSEAASILDDAGEILSKRTQALETPEAPATPAAPVAPSLDGTLLADAR